MLVAVDSLSTDDTEASRGGFSPHTKFTKGTKSTALRSCWRLRRVFLPYFFGQIVVATAMQVGSALFDEGKQW